MFGMDKVIGKVILVIILIIVLLAGSFFVIMDGTLLTLKNLIDLARNSAEASFNTTLSWLGIATVKKSLPRFVISENIVEELKNQLNDQQINTKTNGMTDVVLRKMLLTYAATTSLSDTVCMVEVTPEAIIEDFKKKNPTYKEQNLSIDDIKNLCESLYGKDNSNNVWTMDGNPGYDLYYNSTHFFYFKDSQKEFGDSSEKWYLAIMGSTTITTKDGQTFQYRTADEFVKVKEDWENALTNQGGDSEFWKYATKVTGHETSYDALKISYTRDSASSTKLKVYNIVCEEDSYYYHFKNDGSGVDIEIPKDRSSKTGEERYTFGREGDGCTYEAEETEIDLDTQVDLSQNSVQIELMLNYLDLTGSDEFLETFMDYAIEESEASVTAYSLEDEEIQYDKTTYNIASDFIIEAYDMYDFGVQSGTAPTAARILAAIKSSAGNIGQGLMENEVDIMKEIQNFIDQLSNSDKTSVALDFDLYNDNFKAYYDIIFNRRYTEGSWPADGKVTSIENYKDIDYGGGDKFYVAPLHTYLKCAYDPASSFSLGTISVTEVIRHREVTNHWQLVLASVDTWYKKVNYNTPSPKTLYQTEENGDLATKSEYDNYDEFKASNGISKNDEQIEDKYIYDKLIEQVNGETPGLIGDNYKKQTNNDILADTINGTEIGIGNASQFGNRTINGLAEIAYRDGGDKNSGTKFLSGSDYVYVKYKKTNIMNYKTSKRKKQILEDSNIEETSSNNATEAKIDKFLALLRNKTGTIPNPLHSGEFTGINDDPSIVVRYKDIYEGTVPVGDLLLDNGALMLFDLLERYENTQSLVNVFKYMAYRYSGTDYGVTDISDLMYIFNLSTISGIYGNSIEEKIWFALIDAGYTKEVAAGIMGNLYAESGLNSSLAESGKKLNDTGMNSVQYTAAVNNGSYTKEKFIHDEIGYGLMQWTYYTRKEGLYDYCKRNNKNINDEDAQIGYMLVELKQYKNNGTWASAKTVKDATEKFCKEVERPSIPHMETRKIMAQQYYNNMKDKTRGNYNGTTVEKMMQAAENIRVHCTKKNYQYDATQPDYKEGIRSLWNKKGVCCASYVAWVLVEAGVVDEGTMNKIYYRGVNELYKGLMKTRKFKDMGAIPQSSMQKGDIVFWLGHHTQMYAGNGYWFNGGVERPGPNVKYSSYNAPNAFSSYGTYHVLRPIG